VTVRNLVETRIAAPRDVVWRYIADFSRYPEWNPFTPQVKGVCAAGERVQVFVQLEGKPFWMPRDVTKAEPGKHFEWEGRAWYSYLTPGQRALKMEDDGNGGTLLIDDEFVGGMAFLMPAKMKALLHQRMQEFGAGLKKIVESEQLRRSA